MPLLAADLDGRIVVLDAGHARVILLDTRSERIWRACGGRTGKEISTAVGDTVANVIQTLQDLSGAGLISASGGRWSQVPVTWV
jgi:hypothetical protein